MNEIGRTAFDRDLAGPLKDLAASPGPIEMRIHLEYNPDRITQYNIVPGLMGVVLTMTMVMITALAVTRERERGTMESLLATPALPLEVMTGKIIPYILVGYVQVTVILFAAKVLFHVPMVGSLPLLYLCALSFIAATLAVGITISTLARNQLQAMQMSFFFFLPSLLLSGFMFPFRGMPEWAQAIGEALPLDPFPSRSARHSVERKRILRCVARRLAHPALRGFGDDLRSPAIPAHTRLIEAPDSYMLSTD